MTFIEQLIRSLDLRLEQLDGEIAVLTRAREELVADGAAPGPPGPTPARGPARRTDRRRAGRPSNDAVSVEKLHRLLVDSEEGLTTAAVTAQANADPARVLPKLRQMEAAGSVRRTGRRHGTRWHAVASEEEWVAQRAAELAARSPNG